LIWCLGRERTEPTDAQRLLERLITDRQRLVTDAEVLQEILRRYVAIDRRDAIQPAFDALLGVVDEVLAVDGMVAQRAKQIALGYRRLSARHALHLSFSIEPVPVPISSTEQMPMPYALRSARLTARVSATRISAPRTSGETLDGSALP